MMLPDYGRFSYPQEGPYDRGSIESGKTYSQDHEAFEEVCGKVFAVVYVTYRSVVQGIPTEWWRTVS